MSQAVNYRSLDILGLDLRTAIGIIGLGLPVVQLVSKRLIDGPGFQPSKGH
jgi:hypothetical protein